MFGELDGVADEINQYLAHMHRVTAQQKGRFRIYVYRKSQPLGMSLWRQHGADAVHQTVQIEIRDLQCNLTGLDLGNIQYVFDQG